MSVREYEASGLAYLALVTELLQRLRVADATGGLWEAADLQWWWRKQRRSDQISQTFWLDDSGPVAASILTDWRRAWGCDLILSTDASNTLFHRVWHRALDHVAAEAIGAVEVVVRDDDTRLQESLGAAGFASTGEHGAATWMLPAARPRLPTLPVGFRMVDRTQSSGRPHHLNSVRNGDLVAERLAQSSLYRPDLDLLVEAPNGDAAAYGLFWFDPVTGVGFVEPMHTDENYRRMGLARHVLAAGLDRLTALGSRRLKVNYETDNVASQNLYLAAGFTVSETNTVYARRTT